jgi:hypothetical protein
LLALYLAVVCALAQAQAPASDITALDKYIAAPDASYK